jgi:single-stranded-DNA-specific exonuclease
MPLWNENRIIVREGLKSLEEQPRPGVSDLLFKLSLINKKLDPEKLAWRMAPVINATGRMGCPEKVVSLFLEPSAEKREELANEIIGINMERRKLEGVILKGIEPQVLSSLEIYNKKFIAVYGEEIKRGFTGIIANRLIKRFNIPALAVSFGNDTYIGSLRFPRHYKPHYFQEQFKDLFINCGGHDYAFGFNMDKTKWGLFLKRLFVYDPPIETEQKNNIETLIIDAELPLRYLVPAILKLSDQFEPYGEMNHPLLFLSRGLIVDDCKLIGKGEAKHLKLTLDTGVYTWTGLYWKAADKIKTEFDIDDTVDIVYILNRNYFKGQMIPQLMIQDLKRSNCTRPENQQ